MTLIDISRYAVITGASSGLGRCYAFELARRRVNTILVALPGSGLDAVADDVRACGADCVPFEADITDETSRSELCRKISSYDVCMLVNNAGTGGTRSFTDCDSHYINNIIQLNVTASTLLTHEIVPLIIRGGGGWILNVSSMAGFSPVGYKTVYPASKRFIMDFSRGLRQELRDRGVGVSVVHPGAMRTNEEVTRRIELQGLAGRLSEQSPEYVARVSLDEMLKGRCVIVPGLKNKLNRFVMGLIPSWIRLPLISAVVSRELTARIR